MISNIEIDPLIAVRNPIELLTVAPVIIQIGLVTEKLARNVVEQMSLAHHTGQPVIPMLIDSRGGCVYSMMAIIDAMAHSEIPVATICMGYAFSAAGIIFASGSKGYRYCAPNATIMIHEVSQESESSTMKATEAINSASELARINGIMAKILAFKSGQKKSFFVSRMKGDWFCDAKSAKAIGLADHIGVPTLTTTVSVSMELK